MSKKQVRAVYDFSGQEGSDELSIYTGQLLTLTRLDVGEGWVEGMNERGEIGLFPESYVEEVQSGRDPPAMPPPPLPDAFAASSWDESGEPASATPQEGDFWEDDDWDDDQEGGGSHAGAETQSITSYPGRQQQPQSGSMDLADDMTGGKGEGKGTVGKKNFNRFSGFGRSGLDTFILSPAKFDVSESEKVSIILTEDGVVWNPITDYYDCFVASPKKESKLKGLKSFIAYQITPTFNKIQVSRRYKHFDWLRERLEEKFSLIPIPPLPDKQISGRYEHQFIEHRRVQLQAFVSAVCRHPVLSRCSVWHHFMTCTDEKRWKIGKRKEEKDKFLGANYFYTLETPEVPLDPAQTEQESDECVRLFHNMDSAVKQLMATAADQTKKHQGPYKREYQKIGLAFVQLSSAFKDAPLGGAQDKLTIAIRRTGETYDHIGNMFEEQPKLDWEPLGDMLHIYKGIISSFPDILSVHRGTLQKRKEQERLATEHKVEESQLQEVKRRTDVVSYALQAEVSHFHAERSCDFNKAMKSYLTEQVKFYQKVVDQLQIALSKYD